MPSAHIETASTTGGLPISPSLAPTLQSAKVPLHAAPINIRVVMICLISTAVGAAAGWAAQLLIAMIALITNLSFYGRWSIQHTDPRANHLGPWVIVIPVIGAALIGLLARYGSRAVAGHGIPEAIEHVLKSQSRIPKRMTFLKPFSAALSIGTGGPFGPEGPIIATGGALGSLIGQIINITAPERKVLLAAGAAAGICAAFGSPIAAILLAIELLLFEFRPRSIIPVIFAVTPAALLHAHFEGAGPMFPFTGPTPLFPSATALLAYTLLGIVIGLGAIGLTRGVSAVEHFFEHLPIHWMWQPALGAVAVGVIGYISPSTLGPGYFNLDYLLSDRVVLGAAAVLCTLKFLSWTISLGSGTSGGTLAPVFTIGGALAAVLGILAARIFPSLGIDPRVAALMGMVAIFAGASRALLTSIIFAFEVTRQTPAILPVLCGCASAYVISSLLMRHSIMTEKLANQGVHVPAEYGADELEQFRVADVMTPDPCILAGRQSLAEIGTWVRENSAASTHQGYPIVDDSGHLLGILTRRDLLTSTASPRATLADLIQRPPVVVYSDCSLRDAVDHMVRHDVGRLPVVDRNRPDKVMGIITRGDVLRAQSRQVR